MSNFNLESFKGCEGQIIAGPEVVNGTGQVQLRFCQDDSEESDRVFLEMPAEKVLDLAKWLADHAFDAMRVQWKEANITS